MQASDRTKTGIRLLALLGICNTIFMLYGMFFLLFNLNGGPYPQDVIDRSYFNGGTCGPKTTYACLSPDLPINRPHSAHIGPDGSLVPAS